MHLIRLLYSELCLCHMRALAELCAALVSQFPCLYVPEADCCPDSPVTPPAEKFAVRY